MKFKNKQRWQIIKDYCIGWTLSFLFLLIVRGVGTEEKGLLKFDMPSSLLLALTIGPIVGIISGYTQIWMEERVYKHISLKKFLTLRLIYAFLFISLLVLISYGVYQAYFGTTIDVFTFAFDTGSFANYFYVLVVDFFMAILRQVNLLLGNGKLIKLLQGKFYTPHEEERIFMFLDLQSSTQMAEQLGHIKYSMLIQDCFDDLDIVMENEAEIYQYVGDEVVLTWELADGLRNQNCLNAYFNFKKNSKVGRRIIWNITVVCPFLKRA
ncbi:MAG: hypothetical protein ACPGJS_17420 [Flammeovirgaceae bacterium]